MNVICIKFSSKACSVHYLSHSTVRGISFDGDNIIFFLNSFHPCQSSHPCAIALLSQILVSSNKEPYTSSFYISCLYILYVPTKIFLVPSQDLDMYHIHYHQYQIFLQPYQLYPRSLPDHFSSSPRQY